MLLLLQAEKMKCLAEDVTHLKTVQDDKHAIKNFDCELEKKCCDLAKYVAIEIGMPPWSALNHHLLALTPSYHLVSCAML